MTESNRDTQVNFKTNGSTWRQAKAVFAADHLDATQAFNLFLEYVATRKSLPFATPDETERERLLAELGQRLEDSESAIARGEYVTLEELERRFHD